MSEKEVPLCRDCAWLIGKRTMPEFAAAWKCGEPRNVKGSYTDVVTGEPKNMYKWMDCSSCRGASVAQRVSTLVSAPEEWCGPPGDWFKKYEKPEPMVFQSADSMNKEMDDMLASLGAKP